MQEKLEYVDFDLALNLAIEEYFYYRKNQIAGIGKSFSKAN